MNRCPLFVAALLATALSAPEASGQQSHSATDEAALGATQTAAAPLLRATGLSAELLPPAPTADDAIVPWQSADVSELSAGSRLQFKLWCLGLFLGGAGLYWVGDQAGIDFVAGTGAFVAVVGLLGLIMPTW